MQVNSEDRYVEEQRPPGLPRLPIILVVLAVVIGVAWYFMGGGEPAPEAPPAAVAPTPQPAQPAAEPAPAPDIPEMVEAPPPPAAEPNEPPAPPLTLANSDPMVRDALDKPLTDPMFGQALRQQDLLQRATATIDAASHGNLLLKAVSLPPPKGSFSVIEVAGKATVDPQSYHRYDAYAQAINALDTEQLVAAFHRFRPLLEQAYANLGYKADDLDNSLIRALDEVIAAPVLDQPATLEKDVTTYVYTDESLERLSPLAKQLIRMGPENQRLVQAKARELRAALLGQ